MSIMGACSQRFRLLGVCAGEDGGGRLPPAQILMSGGVPFLGVRSVLKL